MPKIANMWIIDDDPMSSFYIKRLAELGELAGIITIYEKATGAIDYLYSYRHSVEHLPDIILLDIYMPGLDGWGFIEEFQKISSHLDKKVLIYIISSSNHPDDLARAKQLSEVQAYFQKPITIEMLTDIIVNIQKASP